MITDETLRKYAQKRAQECIDDWAYECWYELNDGWGTDFSEDELLAISKLATRAIATLPETSS